MQKMDSSRMNQEQNMKKNYYCYRDLDTIFKIQNKLLNKSNSNAMKAFSNIEKRKPQVITREELDYHLKSKFSITDDNQLNLFFGYFDQDFDEEINISDWESGFNKIGIELIEAKNQQVKYDDLAENSLLYSRNKPAVETPQQKPADFGEFSNIGSKNKGKSASLQTPLSNATSKPNAESCNTTISFSNYIRKFKETESGPSEQGKAEEEAQPQPVANRAQNMQLASQQASKRAVGKKMNIEISIDEKYENFHDRSQDKSLIQDDLVLHMSPKMEIQPSVNINDTFENFLKTNNREDEETLHQNTSQELRLEILGKGVSRISGAEQQLEVSFQQDDTISDERDQGNMLGKEECQKQNKSFKDDSYGNLEPLNMKKSISLENGMKSRFSQGFNESMVSNKENRHSRNMSHIPHNNSLTNTNKIGKNGRSNQGMNEEEGLSEIRNTISSSSDASEIYTEDIKTSSDEEEGADVITSDSQEQQANGEEEEEYNQEKSKNNMSKRFNYNSERSISKIKTFHLDNNSFSGEIIDEDEEKSVEKESSANGWAQRSSEHTEPPEENKDSSLSKSMLSGVDQTPNPQGSVATKSLNHSKTASFQRNQTNEKMCKNPSTKRFLLVSSQEDALARQKQSVASEVQIEEDPMDPKNIRRALSTNRLPSEKASQGGDFDPLVHNNLHKKNQNSMAVHSQQLFFEELNMLSARRQAGNQHSLYSTLPLRNPERDSSFHNDLSALKTNKSFLDNNKSFFEQTNNNINHKNSMISLGKSFDFWDNTNNNYCEESRAHKHKASLLGNERARRTDQEGKQSLESIFKDIHFRDRSQRHMDESDGPVGGITGGENINKNRVGGYLEKAGDSNFQKREQLQSYMDKLGFRNNTYLDSKSPIRMVSPTASNVITRARERTEPVASYLDPVLNVSNVQTNYRVPANRDSENISRRNQNRSPFKENNECNKSQLRRFGDELKLTCNILADETPKTSTIFTNYTEYSNCGYLSSTCKESSNKIDLRNFKLKSDEYRLLLSKTKIVNKENSICTRPSQPAPSSKKYKWAQTKDSHHESSFFKSEEDNNSYIASELEKLERVNRKLADVRYGIVNIKK